MLDELREPLNTVVDLVMAGTVKDSLSALWLDEADRRWAQLDRGAAVR